MSSDQPTGPIDVRKLFSFITVTLDGYYEGPNQEFDWPNADEQFLEFSVTQLNDIDVLLFGRRTYEGMAEYWPSPQGWETNPAIAERMNNLPKVVFSTTLTEATWNNTVLVKDDVPGAVKALKDQPGKELAMFGSSNLTNGLLEQGLVDEVRIMVNPILLGAGRTSFAGLARRVPLKLLRTTVFSSGNVLLSYEPASV